MGQVYYRLTLRVGYALLRLRLQPLNEVCPELYAERRLRQAGAPLQLPHRVQAVLGQPEGRDKHDHRGAGGDGAQRHLRGRPEGDRGAGHLGEGAARCLQEGGLPSLGGGREVVHGGPLQGGEAGGAIHAGEEVRELDGRGHERAWDRPRLREEVCGPLPDAAGVL